jgi:nucleoredoxin
MRFSPGGLVLLLLVAFCFAGNPPPMSLKDVSLMLRSGYSSAAVEQELAKRHFIGTLDAKAESSLATAGASPTLISRLKSGVFAVPAAEAAAMQAELAAKEQRRVAQLEEARKLNSLYQDRLAQSRNISSGNGAVAPAASIASLVKGDLVTSSNGVLHPYLDAAFEKKKLIALYFSNYSYAPCRKFTPTLVEYYNKISAAHPEFEVLFVSFDKSAVAMEAHMRDEQVPWPALSFDKVAGNAALVRYAGPGIPSLAVVDESGKMIFSSFAGKDYRGPEAVLKDLDQFFAGKSPTQVAQMR